MGIDIYNLEFERALLSSVIYETIIGTESKEINIFQYLKEDDFYLPAHVNIYKVILDLREKNIDPDEIIIQNELQKINKFDEEILLKILSANPISNTTPYMVEVKKRKEIRELLALNVEIKKQIEDSSEPNEIMNLIIEKLDYLQNGTNRLNSIVDGESLLNQFKDESPIKRIKTNFPITDIPLEGGFDEGALTVITGEPESGKTHIGYTIAEKTTATQKAGIISLEFGSNDYAARLLQQKIHDSELNVKNLKLNFDSFSISSVISTLYRFANDKVKLVVIDSLHEITNSSFSNPTHAIEDTARRINNVAKKTRMHIILIALGSKEDYAFGRMGVKDSAAVPHLAKIFLRVVNNEEKNERKLYWHKNKQTRKYLTQTLLFEDAGQIYLKIDTQALKKEKVVKQIISLAP